MKYKTYKKLKAFCEMKANHLQKILSESYDLDEDYKALFKNIPDHYHTLGGFIVDLDFKGEPDCILLSAPEWKKMSTFNTLSPVYLKIDPDKVKNPIWHSKDLSSFVVTNATGKVPDTIIKMVDDFEKILDEELEKWIPCLESNFNALLRAKGMKQFGLSKDSYAFSKPGI